MALGYPTGAGTRESQLFGAAKPSASGYASQPAMYAAADIVAYWQPYKGWYRYQHYHNGLDIAGGTDVVLHAMEAGRVTYAGWKSNGGGYVVQVEIRPGTRYSYSHCSRLLVAVGQKVGRAQSLAFIGSTGVATGNHCHVTLEIQEVSGGVTRTLLWNPKLFMAGGAYANDARIKPISSSPSKKYVKFNDGVDGVNIRDKPDARPGKSKVFAVARKDPVGIVRTHNGQKIGNTSARRTLYGVVMGYDAKGNRVPYNKMWIYGTTAYTYVQSIFQHLVPG